MSLHMNNVRNITITAEITMVLAKYASNLCGCSILIVGCRFDDYANTARRIALVNDLIEVLRLVALARATFDSALDVIAWHALRPCRLDRATQTRVSTRITTTGYRGNGYFLG